MGDLNFNFCSLSDSGRFTHQPLVNGYHQPSQPQQQQQQQPRPNMVDDSSSVFLHFVSQVNSNPQPSLARIQMRPNNNNITPILAQTLIPPVSVAPQNPIQQNASTKPADRLKLTDLSSMQCEILIWKYFLGNANLPKSTTATLDHEICSDDLLAVNRLEDLEKLGLRTLPKTKQRRIVESLQCWRDINQGMLPKEVSDYVVQASASVVSNAMKIQEHKTAPASKVNAKKNKKEGIVSPVLPVPLPAPMTVAPLTFSSQKAIQHRNRSDTQSSMSTAGLTIDAETELETDPVLSCPVTNSSLSSSNSADDFHKLPQRWINRNNTKLIEEQSSDKSVGSIDSRGNSSSFSGGLVNAVKEVHILDKTQTGSDDTNDSATEQQIHPPLLSMIVSELSPKGFISAVNSLDPYVPTIPTRGSSSSGGSLDSSVEVLLKIEVFLDKHFGGSISGWNSISNIDETSNLPTAALSMIPGLCEAFKLLVMKTLPWLRGLLQPLNRGDEQIGIAISVDKRKVAFKDCVRRVVSKSLSSIHWMLTKTDTTNAMVACMFENNGFDMLWNEIGVLVSTTTAVADIIGGGSDSLFLESGSSKSDKFKIKNQKKRGEVEIVVYFLRIVSALSVHPMVGVVTRTSLEAIAVAHRQEGRVRHYFTLFPSRCEHLLSMLCTYYQEDSELVEKLCFVLWNISLNRDVCVKLLNSTCTSQYDYSACSCHELLMKVLTFYATQIASRQISDQQQEQYQELMLYLCGTIWKLISFSGPSSSTSPHASNISPTKDVCRFGELGLCEFLVKLLKLELSLAISFSAHKTRSGCSSPVISMSSMTGNHSPSSGSDSVNTGDGGGSNARSEKFQLLVNNVLDQVLGTVGSLIASSDYCHKRLNRAGLSELLIEILRIYSVSLHSSSDCVVETVCGAMWIMMEKDNEQDEESRSGLTRTSHGCDLMLQVLIKYKQLLNDEFEGGTIDPTRKPAIMAVIRQICGAIKIKAKKSPASLQFFLWYDSRERGGLCRLLLKTLQRRSDHEVMFYCLKLLSGLFLITPASATANMVGNGNSMKQSKNQVSSAVSLIQYDNELLVTALTILSETLVYFQNQTSCDSVEQKDKLSDMISCCCTVLTRLFSFLCTRLSIVNRTVCAQSGNHQVLLTAVSEKEPMLMTCILGFLDDQSASCAPPSMNSHFQEEMITAILLLWKNLRMFPTSSSLSMSNNVPEIVKLLYRKCSITTKALSAWNTAGVPMPSALLNLWCWNIASATSSITMQIRAAASKTYPNIFPSSLKMVLYSGRETMTQLLLALLTQIDLHCVGAQQNPSVSGGSETVVYLLWCFHSVLSVNPEMLVPSLLVHLTVASGKYPDENERIDSRSRQSSTNSQIKDDILSDILLPVAGMYLRDPNIIKHLLSIIYTMLSIVFAPPQSTFAGSSNPTNDRNASVAVEDAENDDLCLIFLQASPRAIQSLLFILKHTITQHVFNKAVLQSWCQVVQKCLQSSFFRNSCTSATNTTTSASSPQLMSSTTSSSGLVQVSVTTTNSLISPSIAPANASNGNNTTFEITSFSALLLSFLRQASPYLQEAMTHFYCLDEENAHLLHHSRQDAGLVEMIRNILHIISMNQW